MIAIRKTITLVDETQREGGRVVAEPARVAIVAIVMANPWAGQGFVDDLSPLIDLLAPQIGDYLAPRLIEALGSSIEAYGKAAIVGAKGEIEHGSALIHTLAFGDPLRRRIGATTLLPAVEKRGAIGASFDIPLKHVTDATMRSHHQSVEVRIADAPHADEIVIALAAAAQGRPQARLPAFAERPGTLSLSPAKD